MKKIIPILIIVGLIAGIVAISGCTSSSGKEIKVKEINVASLSSNGVFGGHDALVDIPDNATQVRIVYKLKGANNYGMGSNGNLGVTYENINSNSGENPITKSTSNKYLEAGAGKTVSGEFNSTDHGDFYLSGNFPSGNITIYATVPE
ncbi:hypothetical protein [Methanobacterium sp.]|uniref:hypothetical protein n=1 Tax=Methanobacterium sp. TaxID=2164 RepID=UPI003C77CAC1